jgi:hypothetical protein
MLCLDAQNLAMELEFGANWPNSTVWIAIELRPGNFGPILSHPRARTVSLANFPSSVPRKGVESQLVRTPSSTRDTSRMRGRRELGLLRRPAMRAFPAAAASPAPVSHPICVVLSPTILSSPNLRPPLRLRSSSATPPNPRTAAVGRGTTGGGRWPLLGQ